MEKIPRGLTVQEAADASGVNRVTIYRAVDTGELPAMRVEGKVYVHPGDLSAWTPRKAGRPRKQKGGEE